MIAEPPWPVTADQERIAWPLPGAASRSATAAGLVAASLSETATLATDGDPVWWSEIGTMVAVTVEPNSAALSSSVGTVIVLVN